MSSEFRLSTAPIILEVFDRLSSALRRANIPAIGLIITGGAVSVLAGIRPGPSTEDIDYISLSNNGQMDEDRMPIIEDITRDISYALQLEETFMNSAVRLWFNHQSFEAAIGGSLHQRAIAYHDVNLTVYIADYAYQCISKLDRITRVLRVPQTDRLRHRLQTDAQDGAYYLRKLIQSNQGHPVTRQLLLDSLGIYSSDGLMPLVSNQAIDMVVRAFVAAFGESPLSG